MPLALLILAAGSALVAAAITVTILVGGRSLPFLRDSPAASKGPSVSVIVSALNEAPHIEAALRSMLDQAYAGGFEVIAVDDRSTDETGAILDRMVLREPRLRVIHIHSLPDGWLGKNHALHRAAEVATGEILLFTDADVMFDASALARAVGYMEREGADHLAVAPELDLPTASLALVVNYFAIWFMLYTMPWRVRDAKSRHHLGIGAFNAVRTDLYRRFGGHTPIALRPDDDLKLGKLVKRAGGAQRVAVGTGVLRVRWYATLPEMIRGLRKNAFSGLEYSISLAVGAVIAQLTLNVWPFVALFVVSGAAWWLNLVTASLLVGLYAVVAAVSGKRAWLAPFYPVAAVVFAYILAAATIRTLVRGGIEWRGTFYRLSELRRNTVA